MTRPLAVIALALLALLVVLGAQNQAAMDGCQRAHSFDTCADALL